jgi:hypothetical protein
MLPGRAEPGLTRGAEGGVLFATLGLTWAYVYGTVLFSGRLRVGLPGFTHIGSGWGRSVFCGRTSALGRVWFGRGPGSGFERECL